MSRTLLFAARNLIRQPGRTAVGVLGIAAVGALLFDMLLLSRGLVVSFRELLDTVGFDVRVMAGEIGPIGGPKLAKATAAVQTIAALPEVEEAVALRMADAESAQEGERPIRFGLMAIDGRSRRLWTVTAGADLDDSGAPSLLINRRLQQALGVSPGASLRMRVICASDRAAPSPITFRISGIAEFPFDTGGDLSGAMSRAALLGTCGQEVDDADLVLVASREGYGSEAAVAAIRRARSDLRAATNEEIVQRMQQQGFSYFRQISTVLSTITMLFGFLLITVLLTVSANQRLAEIAALRALGFSRLRVAADVFCQSALLVGIGGVLSIPFGVALSTWLDAILKTMPGIPAAMHFFVFEPRAFALHGALLAATALLAAAYPMRLVSALPIAATLRSEVVG
jgi:ABC-type lipoprotein release transport system permease subunit